MRIYDNNGVLLSIFLTLSMYPSIDGIRVALYRFAGKGVRSGTSIVAWK